MERQTRLNIELACVIYYEEVLPNFHFNTLGVFTALYLETGMRIKM